MRLIDIESKDLETVLSILRARVPEFEVRAFGSRVTGTARKTSDLDLALMTTARLPLARLADLNDDFRESDLPFKVDVVDWAATGETFRRIIERDSLVIKAAGWSGGVDRGR